MSEIQELQRRVGQINEANGWRETPVLTPELQVKQDITEIALIITEASEAIEELRNGRAADEAYFTINGHDVQRAKSGADWVDADGYEYTGVAAKPEGVPSELADIVIRALDFSDKRGIDLATEIDRKLAYNAKRGYRHGGKTA